MSIARLLLPTILLVYFLWRSQRQRIFLLGLPFLMDMYYSIFFDGLKPFWVPKSWYPADHMLFWLVLTWIVYFDLLLPRRYRKVKEAQLFGPRLSPLEEVFLLAFLALMLITIGTTALHYMDLGSALSVARIPVYAFVGYFLVRGIVCHEGRKETMDFLAAVVIVNSIAALLYVLHQGLHIVGIYVAVSEYQYIVFNGQVLTRSFYFMPQFLPLAIAFCAARRTWNLLWLAVFIVTLAAVWVSYTRALIVVAVVEILVILAVRLLKRQEAWAGFKRLLQMSIVLAVFIGAAFVFLPTQSAYLVSRITSTSAQGSATKDTDMQVRFGEWRTTYDWLQADGNVLFGAGFPSQAQDGRTVQVGQMAADFVWVPTVWNLGLLGVVVLAALFAAYGWRAVRLSFDGSGDAASLSMVLLGVVVGVFLLGFVQWTIFDPWHTPVALWFFALLVAERCRQRAEATERVPGLVGSSNASSLVLLGAPAPARREGEAD